jgi:hypothetical protein
MPQRKLPRNVRSGLPNASRDKMLAALSWMLEKQVACLAAPHYLSACRRWYDGLSDEQRQTVSRVVEAYTCWGEIAAARIAADLPPAPRCPL